MMALFVGLLSVFFLFDFDFWYFCSELKSGSYWFHFIWFRDCINWVLFVIHDIVSSSKKGTHFIGLFGKLVQGFVIDLFNFCFIFFKRELVMVTDWSIFQLIKQISLTTLDWNSRYVGKNSLNCLLFM